MKVTRMAAAALLTLALMGCGAADSSGDAGDEPKAEQAAASTTDEPTTTTTDEPTTTTTAAPTTTTSTIPEAKLRDAKHAEVTRACNEAMFYDAEPELDYDSDWSSFGAGRAEVEADVDKCVAEGRAKKEQDRIAAEEAQIAAAGPVNVDEVVKNPDALTGQVFIVFVEITQYDAATGLCALRGYWDSARREHNFEYSGDNGYFFAGDKLTVCPVLDGIDQSDVVRVVVRGAGSLSYDTQNGGNTTVPQFEILRAEVLEKK